MTGTADTEAPEFAKIYQLDVVVIPTNEAVIRIDEPDVIYKDKVQKIKAATNTIKELYAKGQPILVGTSSIDSSEAFSNALKNNNIPHEVLNAKQHQREAEIIARAGEKGSVTIATNMAGRGTDIKLTPETVKLGGLFILGTERNEARRIDNQLRGRSGRQGDLGYSKFFLSLEDDLMRIFGSDRIKKIMTTLGMKDDEPIEHRMITKAIANAQEKVEGHNFEIRKHLLEFDNVMNEHRKVIYRIRKDILSDNENLGFIYEMLEDVCVIFIENYRPKTKVPLESWPWDEMSKGFKVSFDSEISLGYETCLKSFDGALEKYIYDIAKDILDKKLAKHDQEIVQMMLREVLLSTFDQHWKDHLLSMDHIKEGINLKAYAQKDPLTEYKREGFRLFEQMRTDVKRSVINNIFSVKLYTQEEIEQRQQFQKEELEQQLKSHKENLQTDNKPTTRVGKKVGRNQPCPCGSGKKI